MNRKKIIMLAFLIVISTVASLFFTVFFHVSMKEADITVLLDMVIGDYISLILENEQPRTIFLSLWALTSVGSLWFVYNQKGMYESSMKKITKDISTPVSAGQKQHGSAEWVERKDFDKHFASIPLKEGKPYTIDKGGIVLGMYKSFGREIIYYVDDDSNVIIIGSIGSGKSRSIVLTSIGLLALAGESIFLSDTKGELYQFTYPFLEKLGYEVIALDFKNPQRSIRYNFLQHVINAINDDDIPKAIGYAWDITESLVGESKGEKIWTNGEAATIASSILCVVYDNKEHPEYQNLTNVYYFIGEMCKMGKGKMPIERYYETLPETHPSRALLAISGVAPARTRGSFFTSALASLKLFTNPLIASMTCTSDFDITDVTKKRAIFIILPDQKTTYYSVASLFVAQHYQMLVQMADDNGGELPIRYNYLLDEFGNFTPIPNFTSALTAGRGRKIRFNIFVQALAQIDDMYGSDKAKTIIGNCRTLIYRRAEDHDTLKRLSEKLGNYTVASNSKSSSYNSNSLASGSSSESMNLTSRALLTPDEIGKINRPNSLVISKGYPAIFNSPDLAEYSFNKMFGLGDEEHNRKVRKLREQRRPYREYSMTDLQLWGIWKLFPVEEEEQRRPPKVNVDTIPLG